MQISAERYRIVYFWRRLSGTFLVYVFDECFIQMTVTERNVFLLAQTYICFLVFLNKSCFVRDAKGVLVTIDTCDLG